MMVRLRGRRLIWVGSAQQVVQVGLDFGAILEAELSM